MTKINTVSFHQRLQYHTEYSDKSILLVAKNTLLDDTNFKTLHKYITSYENWKTYVLTNVEVTPTPNHSPSPPLTLENFTAGIDSIIFNSCIFDCDVDLRFNSDKVKFVFFINCTFNQKLSISANIQDFLVIKKSKIHSNLTLASGSCVKKQVLLTNSEFKNISIEMNFQSDLFSLVSNCKVSERLYLSDTKVSKIQIENSNIKGSFENIRQEVQQADFRQSISFYKSRIGGKVELKHNRIDAISINELNVTDSFKANIDVCKEISFKGENNFNYVYFKGSTETFKIEKSNINCQISIDVDSKISVLNISSSILKNDFHVKKSKIELIKIEQNSELQAIQGENLDIANIDFQSSKFHGWVSISSTLNQDLKVANCSIYNNFHFLSTNSDTQKTTSIHLSNTFITGSCTIERINCLGIKIDMLVCKNLDLLETKDNGYFLASEILCTDYLKISRKSNYKSLSFNKLYTPFITLENISIDTNKVILSNSHLDKLTHYDLTKFEYLFENSKINQIYFTEKTNPKDCIYTFINCEFSLLKISNFNNLGNLFFRTIKSKNRNQVLANYQTLLLEEIQKSGIENFKIQEEYHKYLNWTSDFTPEKPSIIFSQSSLGKAEFTDFDFDSFGFFYSNSKITETFISGGTLPQTIEISNVEKKTTDYYIQKVGVYNQFKKIFDSQGDNFQSTYFQAKAAENQAELLEQQRKAIIKKEQKSATNWLSKIAIWVKVSAFSHNTFEKLTFWLNKSSNRHGESWIQALKFILFISITFFSIYCWVSGKYYIEWNFSWKNFGDLLGDYVSFLDPTQKIKDDISGWSKIVLFVSKIFIGYGIFQLIAAFRKHGKKSG